MKYKKIIHIICLSSLIFLLIPSITLANGVLPPLGSSPIYMTFILILIFLLGTGIEYKISFLFFSNYLISIKDLRKSIFKVNIITFPLTQVFAYIIWLFFSSLFWIYINLIEMTVIFIEWGLLLIIFERIEIKNSFSSKKVLIYTIIANLCSFLIGVLIFLLQFFPL